MAHLLPDRVLETSTTTGTGDLTLAGAVTGYQSFAAVGDGNTCNYAIEEVDGDGVPSGDWEVGLGTYTASGTTLARTTVYRSSNSDAAVNFGAGTKNVYVARVADEISVSQGTLGGEVFGAGNDGILSGKTRSTVVGADNISVGSDSVLIGWGNTCAGSTSITIGRSCNVTTGSASFVAAVNKTVSPSGGSAVGILCNSLSGFSVAIGAGASTSANGTIAIGRNANVSGASSTAIGHTAVASDDQCIVIGNSTASTGDNQFIVGSDVTYIRDVYFGNGPVSATPSDAYINGTGGSGTDIAGADLTLAGGKGTGAGAGGQVVIQAATPSASGSTLNTLVNVATFDSTSTGNTVTFKEAATQTSPIISITDSSDTELANIDGDTIETRYLKWIGDSSRVFDIATMTVTYSQAFVANCTAGLRINTGQSNSIAYVSRVTTDTIGQQKLSFFTTYVNDIYFGNGINTPTADLQIGRVQIQASDATPAATTNVDGGDILIQSGDSATGSGDGGSITLQPGTGTDNNGQVVIDGVMSFTDNTSDPTMDTNTAGIYGKDVSGTVEMFAVDEAGNTTQLSPHDPDTGEWVFESRNVKTGRKLKVRMEALVKKLAERFPEDFASLIEE